ncbi:MAG: SpoIID/LytB domain-containing protein [bacterium]|nr:SpoIID/LytB domain-containing protein [Candidatus Minthenecus merdequi]
MVSSIKKNQWPTEEGEPVVSVGIMTCEEVEVSFNGIFLNTDTHERYDMQSVTFRDVEAVIIPLSQSSSFTIKNVTIGIGFHWERRENQSFKGSLVLKRDMERTVVINRIKVEDYLQSVISSEMSANAGLELLKAHAIMSRSWLLRINNCDTSVHESTEAYIKWYERDAHTLFDVCADDHCQRYQGITRIVNENALRAVAETRGCVLSYRGEICDARFSKCCGGKTERFSTAWADQDYDYLQPVECPYCDTHDENALRQILNDYDRETVHFHDWVVEYSEAELSELICRRSGIDFGEIIDLIPLERGASGRIYRLKIVGSKCEIEVGKELEIRKWLSESHLYSSNFSIEHINGKFILHGIGWGHGVGLCQIGAAVMATEGFTFDKILAHYFPDSKITKLYE